MRNGRVTIAEIRRGEIVEAAAAVIAEQGIQRLSLSEIEAKVGMSRGQLTYYFKAKEDILLAVFDRMLELMNQQNPAGEFDQLDWLEIVRQVLLLVLQDPPAQPEFLALEYTFLSQINHRDDFRRKLAELYAGWRARSTKALKRDLKKRPAQRRVSPRAMATVVQAIFHGLAMQRAADPQSVASREIVDLCLDMLGTYLWTPGNPRGQGQPGRTREKERRKTAPRNNKRRVPHERNRK